MAAAADRQRDRRGPRDRQPGERAMTRWSSKTKPTPANIRHRIAAAQEAIDGAMDLLKKNDRLWPNDTKGRKYAVPLVNAQAWLQDVQRKLGGTK
jgi:hypothetical protein